MPIKKINGDCLQFCNFSMLFMSFIMLFENYCICSAVQLSHAIASIFPDHSAPPNVLWRSRARAPLG